MPPIGPLRRWSTVIAMPAHKRLIGVCGERRAEVFLWPDRGRDNGALKLKCHCR